MAHLAKFAGGVEGRKLYAHWSRETDEDGNYVTYLREHGGGHIDRDLTKKNFTLGEIKSCDWIKNRLKNVYQKPNQKRPIQSCDIIVTLPQSESKDEENIRKFFDAVYKSLSEQYGKNDNIIGAWVHMDEAQPHIHFAFLPISSRTSKQKPEFKEKLAVHDYWPKKNSLQLMHQKLQNDIDREMGRHIEGINNGITKAQGGNKTITELKAESKKLQEHIEKYKGELVELDRDLKVEPEKSMLGLGEEYYRLTPHQYKRLRTLAKVGINQSSEYERMKSENTRLETENLDMRQRIQRYYIEASAEAEEKYKEIAEEEIKKRKILELEADPFLSIPKKFRGYTKKYLEKARVDYQNGIANVMRAAVEMVRNGSEEISAYRNLRGSFDTIDRNKSISAWLAIIKAMVHEANRQMNGESSPVLPTNWDFPKPSEIDFSIPAVALKMKQKTKEATTQKQKNENTR